MQFLPLFLFALKAAATITLSPIVTPSLHRRDVDFPALLTPQSEVTISYGSPNTEHTASARISALPDHPILLLDSLPVRRVWSNDVNVLVIFSSVEDAERALLIWHGREGMVVIRESREEVFMVKKIEIEDYVVRLWTDRLEWSDAFSSMRMELGYDDEAAASELRKRGNSNKNSTAEEEADGSEVQATLNMAVGNATDRVQLYPPALTSRAAPTREIAPDLQIHCVGCRTQGKVSVHAALDIDATFLSNDKSKRDLAKVETAFFEITVTEELKAWANLEFAGSVTSTLTYQRSLLPTPIVITSIRLGNLIQIGPRVDLEIEAVVKTGVAKANFTYGAEVTIPVAAMARLDYVGKGNNSKATGWNESTITEIPLNFNSVDVGYSFEVNVTARPKLHLGIYSVGMSLDGSEAASIGAGLNLDMPRFYAIGELVSNVSTTSCEAQGVNDYTYFPDAVKLDTGVSLAVVFAAESETNIDFLPNAVERIFNQEWTYDLWRKEFPNPTMCLGIDMKNGTVGKDVGRTVDVPKVEKKVEADGVLPDGVTKEELASATANDTSLPSGVAALVQDDNESSAAPRVQAACAALFVGIATGAWLVL
ncbi:hypothetical protein EDC01DRAFT_304597 [Geopyxis carbonaria]|nr:hypothetical protein EDC01DRAFT_304597 [Geopyxis carbonaria]